MVVQNGYGRSSLPKSYPIVSYFVIKYFTLVGHYTFVHGCDFPILNHIRHGEIINLPYFLFTSLESCIANGVNPSLHQVLIYLMYKYAFDHFPNRNCLLSLPSSSEKKKQGSSMKIELIESKPLRSSDSTSLANLKGKKMLIL